MQKIFKDIIDMLETQKEEVLPSEKYLFGSIGVASTEGFNRGIKNAIGIIMQETEKYQSSKCGLVSKSDVLKVIEDIKCNDDIPKNYGTLLDIMRQIRNMPAISNSDWIPVSERLPEEHKLYDITFKNSAGIHSDSAIYNPCLKRWLWDAGETEPVENEILAWAEKREPYQPKGDD